MEDDELEGEELLTNSVGGSVSRSRKALVKSKMLSNLMKYNPSEQEQSKIINLEILRKLSKLRNQAIAQDSKWSQYHYRDFSKAFKGSGGAIDQASELRHKHIYS